MKRLLFVSILLALLLPPASPALADDAGPETLNQALEVELVSAGPPRRWRELFPPVSPSPRASHAMAYDTARGVAVVFGGADSNGEELDDTWEWDSATMTWSERFPATRPPARLGAGMVYDEARGVTVMFGGTTGLILFNDTWEWDGNDWTQLFPADAPSERWASGLVYDAQRQVIVLFGGLTIHGYVGDTWEWDGTNWSEQFIVGPSARCCMGMAYDSNRNVTVLFGGGASQFFNDTWERAGDGPWQEVLVARKPSQRERPGAAYFPALQRVFLFGGEKFTFNDDTWLWNGQKWVTRTFSPHPDGRCCMGMVYDTVLRGVLLFGGSVSFVEANDTWIFR